LLPSEAGDRGTIVFVEALVGEEEGPLTDMAHSCVAHRPVGDLVDTNLLKEWLETCDAEQFHGVDFIPTPRSLPRIPPSIRVIDVRNRCIVGKDISWVYAALSYTWRPSQQYRLTSGNVTMLTKVNSLDEIMDLIGPKVHDAVRLCSDLAIPFLWFDSLYIVQNDGEEFNTQIQLMDQVYIKSYVTIVSAGCHRRLHGEPIETSTGISRVSESNACKLPSFTADGVTYSTHE
jgi:hypothetical protein